MLPEINQTYHFFDDGKVKPSRHDYITVDKIYKYWRVPLRIKKLIKREQRECFWLYAQKTDYVIKGHRTADPTEEQWFIRTQNNGWFSLGWFSGELDVTGKIFDNACQEYAELGLGDFATACEE